MLAWSGLSHRYASQSGERRQPPVQIQYADFSLPPDRHLLLRGASGSGKSTLLALLTGLLRVQQGRLQVAGNELNGQGARALDAWRGATLGVVPQRLHLSSALSVAQNLELPALACGRRADPARARELLEDLGLADLAQRLPHELSQGQAQRVALARALMHRPRLLVADEPSANLDDGHTQRMLDTMMGVATQEGCTLIVATHDARVATRMRERGDVTELVL